MSLLALAGTNSATGGYEIDNSLKLEADNTEYLTRTPSSAGNEKTWTWSGWVKYTEPTLSPQTVFAGGTDSGSYGALNFRIDAGQLELNTASVGLRTATQKFRDPSAWYHFVVAMDTTQSTANDRIKIYVNGSQITDFSVINNPPQNTDMGVNANELQTISRRSHANDRYFAGYMAELHLIDGTALTPTSFGEYDKDTGIWKPKAYTGSYGTNGYYLDFESSGSLGADSSGNGNNFTLNNITAADQATDTPTNNFTTFNSLKRWNQGRISFTEGATVVNTTSGNAWTTVSNNIGVNKGKWYWEGELYTNEGLQMFGQNPVVSTEININADWYLGQSADKSAGAGYYGSGDDVYYEATYANSSASTTGDIISVAMDCDNNKVHFAVNGVYTNSSDPVNNTNGFAMSDEYQYFAMATYIGDYAFKANFGGYTTISISTPETDENGYGTFEYAPPSGYYALCTKNLEEFG